MWGKRPAPAALCIATRSTPTRVGKTLRRARDRSYANGTCGRFPASRWGLTALPTPRAKTRCSRATLIIPRTRFHGGCTELARGCVEVCWLTSTWWPEGLHPHARGRVFLAVPSWNRQRSCTHTRGDVFCATCQLIHLYQLLHPHAGGRAQKWYSSTTFDVTRLHPHAGGFIPDRR